MPSVDTSVIQMDNQDTLKSVEEALIHSPVVNNYDLDYDYYEQFASNINSFVAEFTCSKTVRSVCDLTNKFFATE